MKKGVKSIILLGITFILLSSFASAAIVNVPLVSGGATGSHCEPTSNNVIRLTSCNSIHFPGLSNNDISEIGPVCINSATCYPTIRYGGLPPGTDTLDYGDLTTNLVEFYIDLDAGGSAGIDPSAITASVEITTGEWFRCKLNGEIIMSGGLGNNVITYTREISSDKFRTGTSNAERNQFKCGVGTWGQNRFQTFVLGSFELNIDATYCGDGNVDIPNDNDFYEECDDGPTGSSTCSSSCVETACASGDVDEDGVCDDVDNCPLVHNPGQEDFLPEIKLLAGDGAEGDTFGVSVAIDGNFIVIGASRDDNQNGADAGSVYVYRLDNLGIQEKIRAGDGAAHDGFGGSVAIDGNTLVIGSKGDNDMGTNSGSVYVYEWDGGRWNFNQKLTASDGAAGDLFGWSVAIDGSMIVIGAWGDDDDGDGSGSTYVYRKDVGGNWNFNQKLLAGDGAAGDKFGGSVAIDGSTIVIGSREDDDLGSRSGSAYVFSWDGINWNFNQKLLAGDGAANGGFGVVSINDNIIVVGSSSESVYVFSWDGINWNEMQKLTASDGAAGDLFGGKVAIDGNNIVIGAFFDDDAGSSSGSAYVFSWDGINWNEMQKLTASDGAAEDNFGGGVDINEGVPVVGVWLDDDKGTNSGSVYVFQGDGIGNACIPGDYFCGDGQAIGDVNGDGFITAEDTLIVADILSTIDAGGQPPSNICCIDVNENDGVDSDDVSLTQSIVLGNSVSPGDCTAPTGVCGDGNVDTPNAEEVIEECDAGSNNGDGLSGCDANCEYSDDYVCGDTREIGDVNDDGFITQADVDILSYISNEYLPYPSEICCGDVSQNASIGGEDVFQTQVIVDDDNVDSPGTCSVVSTSCVFTSLIWDPPLNIFEGEDATIIVEGNAACVNEVINFEVLGENGLLPDDSVNTNPSSVSFISTSPTTSTATTLWNAEYITSIIEIGDPEYYFKAVLRDDSDVNGESGKNAVTELLHVEQTICGDGLIRGDEQCEGSDFDGITCSNQGYDGGILVASDCDASCLITFDSCTDAGYCGDRIINGDETCDLGDDNGLGLGCDDDCQEEPLWECNDNGCFQTPKGLCGELDTKEKCDETDLWTFEVLQSIETIYEDFADANGLDFDFCTNPTDDGALCSCVWDNRNSETNGNCLELVTLDRNNDGDGDDDNEACYLQFNDDLTGSCGTGETEYVVRWTAFGKDDQLTLADPLLNIGCINGSDSFQCPSRVKLPFFTMINFMITLLTIYAIYFVLRRDFE